MDKSPQAWATAIILTVISLFLILSGCTKEPEPYIVASKGEYIHFDNQTGADVLIFVEAWGTCTESKKEYPNFTMKAWRSTDEQNILTFPNGDKRRFIVYALIDNQWLYTGWNFIKNNNILSKETLNSDTIQINKP